MPMQTALKTALLNHIFRTTAYTQPGTINVGLFSGGAELDGVDYARVGVGSADANWSAPAAGTGTRQQVTNVAAIDFGTAGDDWAPSGSEVDEVRIFDNTTFIYSCTEDAAGNPINKIIQSGDPVQIQAGSLAIFFEDGSA